MASETIPPSPWPCRHFVPFRSLPLITLPPLTSDPSTPPLTSDPSKPLLTPLTTSEPLLPFSQLNVQRLETELAFCSKQFAVSEASLVEERGEVMRLFESLQAQEKQVGGGARRGLATRGSPIICCSRQAVVSRPLP